MSRAIDALVFEVGSGINRRTVWCEGGMGWIINPTTGEWEHLSEAPGTGGRSLNASEIVGLILAHGRPNP